MKTSRAGIDLIKSFEGCRLKAYRDAVGVWTIGYGHTSAAGAPAVKSGMTITQQQAEEILAADLVQYEAAVSKALTRAPTQPQFDACVSLAYNIGPGAFATSTVVRKFNAGDLAGAGAAFRLFNKAGGKVMPGLISRREAEIQHFWTVETATTAPQPVPAPEQPTAPETPPVTVPAPRKGLTLGQAMAGLVAAIVAAVAYLLSRGN